MRTSLNFYKVQEIMGKNSKFKSLLIRQLAHFKNQEEKVAETSLNTVEKYLEMTTKSVKLQQRVKKTDSRFEPVFHYKDHI